VYRDHRKRIAKWETHEFAAADAKLRASVTAMETKVAGELSDKTRFSGRCKSRKSIRGRGCDGTSTSARMRADEYRSM